MKVIKQFLFALLLGFAGLAFAGETVDINTADANTLVKILKGVGPDRAAAIIEYRDKNGPFKSADELAKVNGIGKKLVDMNRDAITVGKAEPSHD